MSTATSRRLVLGLGLFAAVMASWWSARQPGDESPPVAAVSRRSAAAGSGMPVAGIASAPPGPAGRPVTPMRRDLFAARTWVVPPPPAPPAAPPRPVAPPLPFTYLGKLMDGTEVTVFVATSERNYALHVGDVVEGGFRIVGIAPPTMSVEYEPMHHRYTLEIGRPN